jgi:HD superfamily phosphohydrolase
MLSKIHNELSLTKDFRCPVHGYISVPKIFCKYFIDTEIFQRLRNIQQTSMRVLFPSAHHDRFCHSLGVFFLGTKVLGCLKNNTVNQFSSMNKTNVQKAEVSFLIACLLHDCAHAPFSHTFENQYNIEDKLEPILHNAAANPSFSEDYRRSKIVPSPHEIASAVLVLTSFMDGIRTCGGDPLLVARMIIGCTSISPKSEIDRYQNCLVQLLNSVAIDVDKLDYILRDTWASGVNNVSIDIDRLLSSITVIRNEQNCLRLAYKKNALSVLQNVVNGRNYLYRWIYGHHKVIYFQEMLVRSVKALAKILSPKSPEKFMASFFSLDAIRKPIQFRRMTFYLPTDGDLYFLLKQHNQNIPETKELFSRTCRKPLWKSFIEYERIFEKITDEKERDRIRNSAEEKLGEYWKSKGGNKSDLVVLDVRPKLMDIQRGNIFVDFGGECIPYNLLSISKETEYNSAKFFYIYGPEEFVKKKKDVIEILFSLV